MTETKAKNAHVWQRDGLDWYVEPTESTAALLRHEQFVGSIHDPCCGGGNIVGTLLNHGYDATGTDIVDRTDRASWFKGEVDFLADHHLPQFDNAVMNPPFYKAKGAEAFIRKALRVTRGKVAAFVDVKFLAGSKRANGLYRDHPPHRVWILTPRPSCPPGEVLKAGGKAEGGTADWCWLVWDNTAPNTGTVISWTRSP